MKKVLVILMLCAGILALTACDGGSSSLATPEAEKTNYVLGGSLENGEDVSLSLDVKDSSSGRAAASIKLLEGYLVYDDMTLACNGTLNTVNGKFQVSSKGSISGVVTLVFSLVGTIEGGKVTSAIITLTIYDGGGTLSGTYSSNLSETTQNVAETSNKVTTAATTNYGFEGEWTGGTITLVLTSTSYTFIDTSGNDTENGSIHIMKDGAAADEWYIAYITNQDMFVEARERGLPVPAQYHGWLVRIVKAKLVSGDLQLVYYDQNVYDGGTKSYVAANVNMATLFSTGNFTSAAFGVYEVHDQDGNNDIDNADAYQAAGEALLLDTVAAGMSYANGVTLSK